MHCVPLLFVAIMLMAYYIGGKGGKLPPLGARWGEIPSPTYFMILSNIDKAVGKMCVDSWLKRMGRGAVKGQDGRGKKGQGRERKEGGGAVASSFCGGIIGPDIATVCLSVYYCYYGYYGSAW